MGWIDFGAVTWWAVGVAFVAAFVFGWFYYSPQGLFPLWSRLGKVSDADLKNSNMGIAFGGTFLGTALGVILLALLMAGLGVQGWAAGVATGALVGLVFRGGAHAIHNGFAARHPGVTLIDLVHDTVALAIAGAILGAAG